MRSAAPAGQYEMLAKTDTPRWIGAILSWSWLQPVARIALTSAFLIGGIQKLVDFPGAVAEQAHVGLQPAWLWATAAIIVELGGSALVIFGRSVWLGAGGSSANSLSPDWGQRAKLQRAYSQPPPRARNMAT